MIEPTRATSLPRIALIAALLACALALPLTSAGAETLPTYTKESLAEYEKQLTGDQIAAVTINKRIRSVRVTLKDGSYFRATYDPHQEPTVYAKLHAKGVPVTVLTPTAAESEAKKAPVKHKLRYIAAGVLVLIVIIVAGVLLFDRRRKLAME